ncbi:ATP/GTP-binding protein [Lyngbya sp. PCC 8106]|uniref:AAA family ATPase n=1 Tax=Lyngbya sp. (strain PCC 8106) TaxID=313612 RepID=UPI0000EAA9BB|nr:ATP-binding protein [Lyngbya sp. PCC 8106]EAW37545.1 hypothetical protein L8106_00920 [Lyngbya sp. PCC 8106]
MLKTLKIENFRGFQSFELQSLGRVNLLVGENNSGKTSILEAIQFLLCSRTNLEPLFKTMIERGEYSLTRDNIRTETELEIRHLFHGHDIDIDSQFSISSLDESDHKKVTISIHSIPSTSELEPDSESDEQLSYENLSANDSVELVKLGFNIRWNSENQESENWERPLSSNGGLSDRYIRMNRLRLSNKNINSVTQFITSSSLSIEMMIELFEDIVLTSEEKLVYEALQTIEPTIERIASISSKIYRSSSSRGGFVVLLSDREQRIPIGSLGDGIWRMLGLSLALASVKGGVLLVDEIDTGLHYSTMSDLWKLIWEAAKKLDVQVFATTHNSDCWTSLASIASREDATEDGITIHRIERGKEKSVVFTEKEIVMAAEREIEVR